MPIIRMHKKAGPMELGNDCATGEGSPVAANNIRVGFDSVDQIPREWHRANPDHDPISKYEEYAHCYGSDSELTCRTDKTGTVFPRDISSLTEFVLDTSRGTVPLWAKGSILNYRFNQQSLGCYGSPEQGRAIISTFFSSAIRRWGDFVPVRFREDNDNYDFEISCSSFQPIINGGPLAASSFLPNELRAKFVIYPALRKMFEENAETALQVLCHELGHIFGLRHFFALVEERGFSAEIFGTHSKFTIMNYGPDSRLTDTDRSDLKMLYQEAWAGRLTTINRTSISLISPRSV